MTDPRLAELSGLAVTDGGLWAMSDGGRRVEVDRIDPHTCAVTGQRTARIDPFDPEDLAVGPDGALWVGDTGDNALARDTVAVIVLPARGSPVLHRFTYPDGPHDAEALLVDGQGRPVVVTKEAIGPAGVYRPDTPPSGTGPVPLRRVGQVALPASDAVGGPVGAFGSRLVTGAAQSADRRVVALRSYTDAWLYPAPDGDPVAALTRAPVRVPLPGEPQGEAIAFAADGTLLSGSEARGGEPGRLRTVDGAVGLVAGASPQLPSPAPPAQPVPAWRSAFIGAAALIGALLVCGFAMAVHGRRRAR